MRQTVRLAILGLVLGGVMAGSAYAVKPEETPENIAKGKAIYDRACMSCHGAKGKGDGPAAFSFSSYSAPRPRDFTQNAFKFRSTPTGQLPTDQDLYRVVTNGVAGYMPQFDGLTEEERWDVIAYVKTFNPAFKAASRQPMEISFPHIPSSPASIATGRKLYIEQGCQLCHGVNGRGDGQLFQQGGLKGHFDLPIKPRDLANLPSFKNGSSARDIFRSIMTGLDGGRMRSFAEAFAGQEEDAWHLANYILSLSREPRP